MACKPMARRGFWAAHPWRAEPLPPCGPQRRLELQGTFQVSFHRTRSAPGPGSRGCPREGHQFFDATRMVPQRLQWEAQCSWSRSQSIRSRHAVPVHVGSADLDLPATLRNGCLMQAQCSCSGCYVALASMPIFYSCSWRITRRLQRRPYGDRSMHAYKSTEVIL